MILRNKILNAESPNSHVFCKTRSTINVGVCLPNTDRSINQSLPASVVAKYPPVERMK